MKHSAMRLRGLLLAACGSAVTIRGAAQRPVEPTGLSAGGLESALLGMLDQGNTPALQQFVAQ